VIHNYGKPWWNDIDRGKPKDWEENLSRCPPQIPHGLTLLSHVLNRYLSIRITIIIIIISGSTVLVKDLGRLTLEVS
jgi:hypothetical protein